MLYRVIHIEQMSSLQPLNVHQYDAIRQQASEIHAYAPDARVLTTYYSGKSISNWNFIAHYIHFLLFDFITMC